MKGFHVTVFNPQDKATCQQWALVLYRSTFVLKNIHIVLSLSGDFCPDSCLFNHLISYRTVMNLRPPPLDWGLRGDKSDLISPSLARAGCSAGWAQTWGGD